MIVNVVTAWTLANSILIFFLSFLLLGVTNSLIRLIAQTLSTLDTVIAAPPPRHLTPTPGQLGFARQTPLQWNDHARQIQGGAAAAAETLRYGGIRRVKQIVPVIVSF